ncbi:hypothetical protein AB1Y20_013421 [Prymnesium parvum]|uniref:Thioredoxin domain-containing protein n=1 Tax=Prymnesium parvum TaxID=97485 RepID=A0AB34IHP6_PRYPA
MLLPLLLLLSAAVEGRVIELTRSNWYARTQGHTWYVMFYQQGCKHCQRMKPMWEAVADSLATSPVKVGKIDCSAHNGVARTFGIDKFPYVLLFDADGAVYEYTGKRGLPPLLSFAQGGFHQQEPMMQTPAELLDDVSEWYLLALVLWKPIALSLGVASGLALCLKGGALLLLRLLQPKQVAKTKKPESSETKMD